MQTKEHDKKKHKARKKINTMYVSFTEVIGLYEQAIFVIPSKLWSHDMGCRGGAYK